MSPSRPNSTASRSPRCRKCRDRRPAASPDSSGYRAANPAAGRASASSITRRKFCNTPRATGLSTDCWRSADRIEAEAAHVAGETGQQYPHERSVELGMELQPPDRRSVSHRLHTMTIAGEQRCPLRQRGDALRVGGLREEPLRHAAEQRVAGRCRRRFDGDGPVLRTGRIVGHGAAERVANQLVPEADTQHRHRAGIVGDPARCPLRPFGARSVTIAADPVTTTAETSPASGSDPSASTLNSTISSGGKPQAAGEHVVIVAAERLKAVRRFPGDRVRC